MTKAKLRQFPEGDLILIFPDKPAFGDNRSGKMDQVMGFWRLATNRYKYGDCDPSLISSLNEPDLDNPEKREELNQLVKQCQWNLKQEIEI